MSQVYAICGGLYIESEDFQIIDGALTTADAEEVTDVVNACGLELDASFFSVRRNVNGRNPVITTIYAEEAVPKTTIKPSCNGVLFDSTFFAVNDEGSLIMNPTKALIFIVTPEGATITVKDSEETEIEPIESSSTIFLMPDAEETYTYTITLEGYQTVTDSVPGNAEKIVEVELQPDAEG